MALTRIALAALFALAAAAAAPAQTADTPNRPSLLQGAGLLEFQQLDISREGAPFASLALPQGGGVRAVPRDMSGAGEGVIAGWDFVTEGGTFVESLTLTTARIDLADTETRRFALANLLVLRSFPQVVAQFPTARLLGFGPLVHEGGLDAVQMVGSFELPEEERGILFRHVGLMQPGSTEIVVAIVNVDTGIFPVRGQSDVVDTFAGAALRTLKLAPPAP